MDTNDPKRARATDPLRHGPNATKELFNKLSREGNGFPTESVIGAASNMLLNAIRQEAETWPDAEARFDELFGKLKQILSEHYEHGTGRRRSVFPFNQTIDIPYLGKLKAH